MVHNLARLDLNGTRLDLSENGVDLIRPDIQLSSKYKYIRSGPNLQDNLSMQSFLPLRHSAHHSSAPLEVLSLLPA